MRARHILVAGLLFGVATSRAAEPKELRDAREQYEQSAPNPNEAARSAYLTRLVRLREKLAKANGDWQAVDAEVKRHPLPQKSDRKALSKLLAGKWESPRHDYLYRPNGTWTMLPAMEDGQANTHGRWRIEGNHLVESVATTPPTNSRDTILLLTAKDFVTTDGEAVFYRSRLERSP